MAVTADRVVVELEARTANLQAGMRGAAQATDAAMSQIEKSASRAESAIRGSTNVVKLSAGAQANATRNLGRQIADVGSQLASGSSPFMILAQQAPQFADAMAGTQGAAGRLASFFAGPWGAALLAAASVAGVLISKLFEAEGAHEAVAKAADAAAEAEKNLQDVLGGTIQSSERARIAALDRANASRLAAIAAVNEAKAQLALAQALQRKANADAVGGRALNYGAQGVAIMADQRADDRALELDQAQRNLNALEIRVRNLDVAAKAARQIEAKEAADKDGKKDAATQRKAEAEARRAQREAQRAAEEEARNRRQFTNDLARSRGELLTAEADLTADTKLQDEAIRQRIINERDRAKADIDANPNYEAAQRTELKALEDRIAQAKLNRVTLEAGERLLRDELAIRQASFENERDALQGQGDLATTLSERRDIALRLVDLAYQQERAQLEAVEASKTASEAEKQIARQRLAALDNLQQLSVASVNRSHEGPIAQVGRDFEDVNTALEQVEANALRRLREGLADATVKALGLKGALGDVVGQLIEIGIQRAIIGPLADAMFGPAGGGGGAIGGFLGSLFGRASGGYVGAGQMIRVNEGASPGRVEGFRPLGAGHIIPLGQMKAARAGGTTVVQHITLQAPNSILASELVDFVEQRSQQAAQAGAQGGYSLARRDMESLGRTRM